MPRFFLLATVSLITFASPSSVSAQSYVDPYATQMIRGINWGFINEAGLNMLVDSLHCNVVHTGLVGDAENAAAVRSKHKIKLIVADYKRNIYQSVGQTERMTVWPGVPGDGRDSSRFCFRHREPTYTAIGDTIVRLDSGHTANFSQIQFGRGQWYRDTGALDTLHLTLKAQRTSHANPADTLFLVTLLRMRVLGYNVCDSTYSVDSVSTDSFVFTAAQIPDTGATEVTFSFPWTHRKQDSPYSDVDSTDIQVLWTGKCDAVFHWIRLENTPASHLFDIQKGDLFYDTIKTRMGELEGLYDTLLYRAYIDDESKATFWEPLRHLHDLMDSAAVELHGSNAAIFKLPVSSEMTGSVVRSFHGVVGPREAWIGWGITTATEVVPYIDTGYGGYCGVVTGPACDSLHRIWFGNTLGYRSFYHINDTNWHYSNTLELGPHGMQRQIGDAAAYALQPGAGMRLRGAHWWANPFFCGKFHRLTGTFDHARVATAEQIRLMMNLSVLFGASGVLPFTMADDYPETDPAGDQDLLQTGVCKNDLTHDSNYVHVSITHSGITDSATLFTGHHANYEELRRRMTWLVDNGAFFAKARFVGAAVHAARWVSPCVGDYTFDTVTYLAGVTPLVNRTDVRTAGLPDNRTEHESVTDSSQFSYWAVGQFKSAEGHDSVDYLFVCNTRTDPRSSTDRLLDTCPFADGSYPPAFDSVWRGTRILSIPLATDSLTHVQEVAVDASVHGTVLDTVVAAGGAFTTRLLPGAAKLFRIEKATSYFASEASETIWNNGRRSDYNGYYHTATRLGPHVYYTRSEVCGDGDDPLAGFKNARQLDTFLDSAKHPSIRTANSTVGVVYEGRHGDTVFVRLAWHAYNGIDTLGYLWQTVTVDSFIAPSSSFEATPVLSPFYRVPTGSEHHFTGFVLAWGHDTHGISARTFTFANTNGPIGFGDTINCYSDSAGLACAFPTLCERAFPDQNDSCDLAFHEIRSTGSHIWYRGLRLDEHSDDAIEWRVNLSRGGPECPSRNAHWGCLNLHPNIDDWHSDFFGFAPRLVWEIDEVVSHPELTASPSYIGAIMSAVRINGTWSQFVKFISRKSAYHHPSVRVFTSETVDELPTHIGPSDCPGCAHPMSFKTKFTETPDTTHVGILMRQPVRIGFYTPSKRLISADAKDGILQLNAPVKGWVS